MFALSTVWNADRWLHGDEIAAEIHRLGFQKIELNFSLTREMVEGVARYARDHRLLITSLHNYCPTPPGLSRQEALPDCFSLSSLDEDERKKAVQYTRATIQTAREVGARCVVLHCGRVEIKDRTRELIGLFNKGLKDSEGYADTVEAFTADREKNKAGYFDRILRSLDELSDTAQENGVWLGIENRF